MLNARYYKYVYMLLSEYNIKLLITNIIFIIHKIYSVLKGTLNLLKTKVFLEINGLIFIRFSLRR